MRLRRELERAAISVATPAPWSPAAAPLDDEQLRLWALVHTGRHISIASLALAAALVPQIGPNRLWIAALVLAVVLPYSIALDLHIRRHRRLPPIQAYLDQLLGLPFALIEPMTFTPVILVLIAAVALATVAFGRAIAVRAAVIGAAGLTAVALLHMIPDSPIGVVGFGIVCGMIILTVGAVTDWERQARGRYRSLVDNLDAVVWEADAETLTLLFVSHAIENLLGYPSASWTDEPERWMQRVHPDDRQRVHSQLLAVVASGGTHELEYRLVTSAGEPIWVRDQARLVGDERGRPRLAGVLIDTTAARQSAERLRQYGDIVENMQAGVSLWHLADPEDTASLRMLATNPAGLKLMAMPATIVGKRMVETFPELVDRGFAEVVATVIRDGVPTQFEDRGYSNERIGDRVFSVRVFPLPGGSAGVAFEDVTEQKEAEDAIRHQALHDTLTGLPNRALLHDRLSQAAARAARHGEVAALLLMDLDQFKEVNDTLGHPLGDRLLQLVGVRLREQLRETDTVARLGGDEFAILLPDSSDGEALVVAEKLRRALEVPFDLAGMSVLSTASIGIVYTPDHGTDAETLVSRADVAMYAAKRSGQGCAVYAAEEDRSSVRRLAMVGELRGALDNDELVAHFQPKVELATGRVVGAEALVRWQHPVEGLLLPGEFIELAEVSGLIQPLAWRVLELAVAQCRRWRDQGFDLGVAVNLSVRNLYDPGLPERVSHLLRTHGVAPSQLMLEITESQIVDDPRQVVAALEALDALGVQISIDDFGTGYSSLSHLRQLPIHELKIDRSFVLDMLLDDNDAVIVRSIIDLAHNLGLRVVAEGVESEGVVEALARLGCDHVQGNYLRVPASSEEITQWLMERRPLAALPMPA